MSRTETGMNLYLGALLLGVNLVLFNVLVGRTRIGRLDLTDGHYYSLSPVTRELMADLEEPGEIVFYYSSPETQHEKLRPLIDPLRDLVAEFSAESDGRVRVRFVVLDKAGKKEQDEAENAYGVRPYSIPVRGAFESGIRKTYFSVVVASGSDYEHFTLENLIRVVDRGGSDWEVELADIENLVAKALRKVARGFNSVPGALASRDRKAEVTYFVTPELLPKHLEGLKATVEKVCERLKRESAGRLELQVVNPYEGRKDDERGAIDLQLNKKFGVRPIPVDILSDQRYHSWMTLAVDKETDSFPLYTASASIGEADVKAEIEASLKRLIPGYLPVVGLAAPEPPFNPMMMQMGQRPPRPEFAYLNKALGSDYEVRSVNLEGGEGALPRNLGVLLLVRPGDLSEKALYEIDQFVMRGGRLVVLADSFCLDATMSQQTGNIALTKVENQKFGDLLAHYGAKILPEMVMDKRCEYLPIRDVRYVGGEPVEVYVDTEYPFFTRLGPESLDPNHPITAGLQLGGLFWATPLEIGTVPEGVKATVLIRSSKDSSTTNSTANVQSILETGYKPPENAKSYPLAVVLQGRFTSYFADKPIPGLDKPADGDKKKGEEKKEAAAPGTGTDAAKEPGAEKKAEPGAPLRETRRPTTIVVVGDSDFLSPTVFSAFNQSRELLDGNLRFLANALDYGGPESEMIAVRNRPPIRRPLEGLAGLSPEQKQSQAHWTFIWTCVISVAALLVVAVGWTIHRRSQKPLALLPAAPAEGGAS